MAAALACLSGHPQAQLVSWDARVVRSAAELERAISAAPEVVGEAEDLLAEAAGLLPGGGPG
eukprot:14593046-Alexandrium_andersonii.AAC.1